MRFPGSYRLLSVLLFGWLLICTATVALADVYTPPTFVGASVPGTAALGASVSIGATFATHYSDDGSLNYSSPDQLKLYRIIMTVTKPDGSSFNAADWIPGWPVGNAYSENVESSYASFTADQVGVFYVQFTAMDGRPWYGSSGYYSVTVSSPTPVITSSLATKTDALSQATSYQITATNSPTSFNATGLPTGLSINPGSGYISGTPTAAGTYSVTLYAANAAATGSALFSWIISAPAIGNAPTTTPTSITYGSSVTLRPNGSANFGLAWIDNVIFPPASGGFQVGTQYGAAANNPLSFTPAQGLGTYTYLTRVVDNYSNYTDAVAYFTVTAAPQTVAVTPTSQTITAGGSVTFTASGGQNGYVWGGSASGSGATKTVAFPTPGTFTVTVYSSSGGVYGQSNTATASVTVNAAPQTVAISPGIQTITVGQAISFTVSGGNTSYIWGGAASGVGSSNSVTFGAPGTFSVTVYATAGGIYAQSNTASATITVNPLAQSVAISPASPSITVGQSITFSASGGNNGYVWGAAGTGSSGSSIITGFATAGTSSVTVYSPAGGIYGQSPTATATVTIGKATPVGSFSNRTLTVANSGYYSITPGDLNSVFSNPFTSTPTSPTGAITYTVNGTTAVQVGTLFGPGSVTISANYPGDANFNGASVSAVFTFIQNPPVITSAASVNGTLGSAFSYAISATNTPTSFSAGSLPAGLSFNTSSGVISGTPQVAGVFTVNLGATNAGGSVSLNLQITIATVSVPSSGTVTFADAIAQGFSGASSASKIATISNTGNSTLTISILSVFGDQAISDFSISGASPTSVAPGGTADVTVLFTPKGTGARTGQFVIFNNDSPTSTMKYILQGNGTAAPTFYTLTVLSGPNGSASGAGTFLAGTTVSALATAATNFGFDFWDGDISSASTALSFPLNSDTTITAHFIATNYTLTTAVSGSGTVTPGGTYAASTWISATATPSSNTRFTGWSGDATGTSNPLMIQMTADKYITAVFDAKFTQSINFPNPGNQPTGSVVTLAATSSSGLPVTYTIVSGPATLVGNQVTVTGSGTISVSADQPGNSTYLAAPTVTISFATYGPAQTRILPRGSDVNVQNEKTTGIGNVIIKK